MKKLILFLFSYLLSFNLYSIEIPNAKNGVLDLTDWDFKKHEIIELNGEWKFITGDNYQHEKREAIFSNLDNINLPAYWNHIFKDGKGTLWYLLNIYLPDNIEGDIGLYLKYAFTCYELYINGEKILSRGIIKASSENIPQFLPAYSKIDHRQRVLKIAWRVSNYHDAKGGAFYPVILGKYNALQTMRNKINLIEYFQLFFVSSILMVIPEKRNRLFNFFFMCVEYFYQNSRCQ